MEKKYAYKQRGEKAELIFDKNKHLCYNEHRCLLHSVGGQIFPPAKEVSKMEVIEVLTLLLLITEIISLVVSIYSNKKK